MSSLIKDFQSNKQGNWIEDLRKGENHYINICVYCKQEFLGSKYRRVCFKCYTDLSKKKYD